MECDNDRAAQKKAELVRIAEAAILDYWRSVGEEPDPLRVANIANETINTFVQITPPEKARLECITMRHGGYGGGRSSKSGNLLLNMRKLFTAIASGVMTTVGVIAAPWTAPFAALLLWDRVKSSLNIDITEREAVLLWTMWKNRDLNNYVSEQDLLDLVNSELNSNGRPAISKQQMGDSLETLSNMSCVERTTSIASKWWLCERVNATYT